MWWCADWLVSTIWVSRWQGVQKSLPCSPAAPLAYQFYCLCFLNCMFSLGLCSISLISVPFQVGRNIDRWLWMLSARRIMTRAEGDCNVVQSKHGSIEADFEAWKSKFLDCLQALCRGEKKPCSGKCKKGKCKSQGKPSKESSNPERGAPEFENAEVEPKSMGSYFWCGAYWSAIWRFLPSVPQARGVLWGA